MDILFTLVLLLMLFIVHRIAQGLMERETRTAKWMRHVQEQLERSKE